MKRIVLGSLLLLISAGSADAMSWFFSGSVSEVYDYAGVLVGDRAIAVGDGLSAEYTLDPTAVPSSGQTSTGTYGSNYSHFTDSVLNLKVVVGGDVLVDSAYRIQMLTIANGSPGDYVELWTDGMIDNYLDPWGENGYGEFVDSRLYLTDLDRTVFDGLNIGGFDPIPDVLPMSAFEYGSISFVAQDADETALYQIRSSPVSFSTSPVTPVPEPSTFALVSLGLFALRRRARPRARRLNA